MGEVENAFLCYDLAIECDIINSQAHYHKGNGLKAIGEYNQALKCYDLAIQCDPANWNAHY